LNPITLKETPTLGSTPLDKGAVRRRGLYLTTQTLTRDIHATDGILTRNPCKRAAVDCRGIGIGERN